ncbi:MAG: FecR domain-containing protein [Anaerolineae bacterium]|nr:FecR domain-containing protein [Anaerolineae bacterium]
MPRELSKALDDSLASLETGQATIEECLSGHPEHAAELRPLLETAVQVSQVPRPAMDGVAFFAGRQKMLRALAEKTRRPAGIPGLFYRWEKQPVLQWAPAVVAVALVLLIAGVLITQSRPETRVSQVATLGQVDGPVNISLAGSDTWQLASAGDPVKAGDRIATGPLASVTLTFFDGSTTALEAETKLTIVQLNTRRDGSSKVIVLHQEVGQTYSRVQPLLDPDARFEIKTPTAVMAVRGTEFALDVDSDGATHVAVVEGAVDVTAEGITISVPAGEAAEVKPGTPPAAVLSDEPTLPGPTKTPPVGKSEPTEMTEATQTPKPESTQAPKPPEPTSKPPEPTPKPPEPTSKPPEPTSKPPEPTSKPPEPTSKPPEPTSEPPEPTSEPPEPTKKPHPTHPPHPTEKPKD